MSIINLSKLADSEANASQLFSAVYTNRYIKKKVASRCPLNASSSGRSMVEMLGVLAIIGVLSVGAIAGYSKAMNKYRLNKFTQQLSFLLNTSIATSDKFSPSESTTSLLTPYYIKLNYIPQEMIKKNTTEFIYTSFGNSIVVKYINWKVRTYIETTLYLNHGDKDQCLAAFNVINELKDDIYITNLYTLTETGENQSVGEFKYTLSGNGVCYALNNACLKDLNLNDYERICKECEDEHQYCVLNISYALQGNP